ncbi:MAG: UTRA domain-containing protein [Salinarimonas sp.]|nr:UTRA domain-containing protein [Salinarimonas sp.]
MRSDDVPPPSVPDLAQSGPRRSTTTWQVIRDDVLARIRSRAWPPGELIPHEAELAAEYGCARSTVNRALREVAATGLIDRRRKAGTRVALNPLRRATLHIPVIRQEVETRGARYDYALISREHVSAPLAIRSRMGLPPQTRLLHVRALHLADGIAHAYEDRWINPQAVPEIMEVDFARISANAWLVQNVPYTRGELTLSAAAADADCAACLLCAPGAAIFTMERITWIGDQPVTLVTQSHPPGYAISTAI